MTPLHAVAARGGIVDHGFDRPVFAQSQARRDLEHVAAYLLRHGADVDAADAAGRTPLLAAAAGGTVEMVRLLLGNGASLVATDSAGRDALAYAATADEDRADVVRALSARRRAT